MAAVRGVMTDLVCGRAGPAEGEPRSRELVRWTVRDNLRASGSSRAGLMQRTNDPVSERPFWSEWTEDSGWRPARQYVDV